MERLESGLLHTSLVFGDGTPYTGMMKIEAIRFKTCVTVSAETYAVVCQLTMNGNGVSHMQHLIMCIQRDIGRFRALRLGNCL